VILSMTLFGLSCAQVIFYYRRYSDDPVSLRSFVGFLWFVDTVRTMMDVAMSWYWTVQHHGQIAELTVIPSALVAETLLAKVVIVAVQCYFIHVIWRVSAHSSIQHPLTILGLLFALVAFGAGLAQAIQAAVNNNRTITISDELVPGTLGTGAAFLTDAYITISLCILLHGHRTGLSRTENMITRLVTYAVARGIFTALFQIVSCVTYGTSTHKVSLPWVVALLPGNAVYFNSLLSALNTRHHVRDRDAEYGLSGIELPGLSLPGIRSGDNITFPATPIRNGPTTPSKGSPTHA